FALYHFLNLADIQFGFGNFGQHPQIVDAVGRDFVRGEGFRPAEEITLEIEEADFFGRDEILASFDLFGQHAATPRTVAFDHGGSVSRRGIAEVYFNNVGDFSQRFAGIVYGKVIQHDGVSCLLQPAAGGHHQIVGGDALENL